MAQLKSFVSIGAGNVATHLVKSLCRSGYHLLQVYSRTSGSSRYLAGNFKAESTTSVSEINPDADFYLVSLPDSVLPDFLKEFNIQNKLIFHTAGSLGLEVFGNKYPYSAVLYPLQTFSRIIDLKLDDTPLLIEASNEKALVEIKKIAKSISSEIYSTDAETRRWIHLAGVFACNFTNHMFAASSEILKSKNLDPALLKPLINETFRKSQIADPLLVQTGPAIRNDINTMERHFKMLENLPFLQKIYTFTSQSILFSKSWLKNI